MKYIGTFDVMKLLNIKTKHTIYRWIKCNTLLFPQPFVDKNGAYKWQEADIEYWRAQQLKKGRVL